MRTVAAIVLSIMAVYACAEMNRINEWSGVSEQWGALRQFSDSLHGKMCARKPQIPYMLGCKWYAMPTDLVFEKCERGGVEFILFTDIERRLRPSVFYDAVKGNTGNYKPYIETDYCLILNLTKKGK